jgi:hypothetical protein
MSQIKSFKEFLKSRSVTFVDIDETLFRTFAKIKVIKNGKIVASLNNTEFNTYQLEDGESFDFGEFRNSELFKRTSIPIQTTISLLNRIQRSAKQRNSPIYLLTARADFDNKDSLLDFLKTHNIDVGHHRDGKVHIIRAGNISSGKGSAVNKKIMIHKIMQMGNFNYVVLVDDDLSNLNAFLSVPYELSKKTILSSGGKIIFHAIIVDHGNMKDYRKEVISINK